MKIKITGISGYLGCLISKELTKNGHAVSGIERKLLYGSPENLKSKIGGSDIIVNLAGAPILQRWTQKNKTIIYDSRVKTTQNLVKAVNLLPKSRQPKKIISASAIGIYKAGKYHNESSKNFDHGFVGLVVKDWEKALSGLPENICTITFRISLVLGRKAKTIQNLLIPFKLGLGATIGNGKQGFPFIHEQDVARAFLWAVEDYQKSDIFNLAAPQNITNKEFTHALAKSLHRPAFLSIPDFVFKILYGKAAELISKSPSVSSEKIVKAGYSFNFPDIDSTLQEIINSD